MSASYFGNGVGGHTVNVPAVVLKSQPVTGAVVNFAAVQWINGATAWSPAKAVWASTDFYEPLGFAVNVVGGSADIYVAGILDGFPAFGAFAGYDVYVDPNTAGAITFLPNPFTDTYTVMGKAISQTAIKIQPYNASDYITAKGGLLTNAGLNNGTGDQNLTVGADGNVLTARSAASLGLAWQPAVVAAAPFTYTLATRTLTIANATDSVPGVLSATDHTTYTGYAASIALKAPLASPTLTGDVTASTGNIIVSTLGKGLRIKSGVNSRLGTAVLAAGTVTVPNTSVTANSLIFLTAQTTGGTAGALRISAKTVNTSFVITSTSSTDTSTVAWSILESI